MKNRICIIRSYASGVHFGEIAETRDTVHGLSVTLKNSRRIHYWEGACSLSQVAMELPEIQVENVIEIIPMTAAAIDSLKDQPVWKV